MFVMAIGRYMGRRLHLFTFLPRNVNAFLEYWVPVSRA